MRAHIRVPEHVVSRAFEAETVLLNLRTGSYHGLNATGGRMLSLLRETGSVLATAETISEETSHPVEDITRDLTRLCTGLAERGLIELDVAASG